MAETYTITLRRSGPWVGRESEETYQLGDFGFSDEEWDALSDREKDDLISEFAEREFWNAGYEFSGEVNSG